MQRILTPQQAVKQEIWNKINTLLKANNVMLVPKIILSPQGMACEIEMTDIPVTPAGRIAMPVGGSK